MTLEKLDMTEEELMETRDRTLEEAYEVHDIGYDILVARLESHGFIVEDHGDDERDIDGVYLGEGPDLAIYDCGDDYRENRSGVGSQYIECKTGRFVPETEALELVCYIEIKTKEDPEWFGRCNLRHFREYVNFSNDVDVPVFIWFAYIDSDAGVLHRENFVEVEDTDQIEGDVVDVSDDTVVFDKGDVDVVNNEGLRAVEGDDIINIESSDIIVDHIPDVWGNQVIELNDDDFRSWPHFLHQVQ